VKRLALACGLLALLGPAAARASEGDVLLDVGPSVSFYNDDSRHQPSIGGQLALTWGLNDLTDLGFFAKVDHSTNKFTDDSVLTSAFGLTSWLTTYSGGIRPQVGGQIGYGRVEKSSYLHLALQARALIELTTHFRIFVGATAGGLVGDHGAAFVAADMGAQLLF
jgi:hypothetical protein